MKRILLFVAVALAYLTVTAQSPYNDSIYYVACRLYENGKYKDAVKLFEEVRELDKKESPEDINLPAITSHWLAACHYKAGNLEKAKENDPLFYELPPSDRALTAEARKYAIYSETATDINMAIHWAERCLEEEIKALGENSSFVYGSYCILSHLAFMAGDEAKCRAYIYKAKTTGENLNISDPSWKAMYLAMECELEAALGNHEAATADAELVMDYAKGKMKPLGFPYLIAMRTLLGGYFRDFDIDATNKLAQSATEEFKALKDVDMAGYLMIAQCIAEYYQLTNQPAAGLDICDYGIAAALPDSESMAELLYSRAQINQLLQNYDQAISDIQQTIDIYSALYPRKGEFLARFYLSMGECYDNKRDFNKSEECFRTALKGYRKQGEAGIAGHVKSLHHLATLESRLNNYKAALDYLDECRDIMEKQGVGSEGDRAYILNEMGTCEMGHRNFEAAEVHFRKAMEIYEGNEELKPDNDFYYAAATGLCSIIMAKNPESPEAAKILGNLENLFSGDNPYHKRVRINLWQFEAAKLGEAGRYDESLVLLDKCIDLAGEVDYLEVGELYKNKFSCLLNAEHVEEARLLYNDYRRKTEKRFGEFSKEYLECLEMWASLALTVGSLSDIVEMNVMCDKMLELASNFYADNDPLFYSIQIHAAMRKSLTHPGEAAEILKKVMANTKSLPDTYRPLAFKILSDIECNRANYEKALEYGKKCVESAKEAKWSQVGNLSECYNCLGKAYLMNNQLSKAEDAFKTALDYALKVNGGANSSSYLVCLNLSKLYSKMGKYDLENEYLAKVQSIGSSRYNDNESIRFLSLSNSVWQKYSEGRKYECLADIDEMDRLLGAFKDVPNANLSLPLQFRARFWMLEKDLDKAWVYGKTALSKLRDLENMKLCAQIAFQRNDYDSSMDLTKEALKTVEYVLGKDSYETIPIYMLMGDIHLAKGNAKEATKNYRRTFETGCNYIYDNIFTLTAEQRADFWASNYDFFRVYLPGLCVNFETDAEMGGLLYDAMLFTNGLLLNVDKSIIRTVQSSSEEVKNLYAELNSKKDLMVRISSQGGESGELGADVRRLEKELLGKLGTTEDADKRYSAPTWQKVKKSLPKNAVAIEFIDCPIDSSLNMILALVLTKDMKFPQVVKLFPHGRDDYFDGMHAAEDTEMSAALWGNLANYLQGCTEIYFVPQGSLCAYPVEALPLPKDKFPDPVSIHRLSSTAELIYTKKKTRDSSGATLYGGLNYETTVQELQTDAERYPEVQHRGILPGKFLSARFAREGDVVIPFLEGSKKEVDTIAYLIRRKEGKEPVSKQWNEGTETSFKALSGSYGHVLHISTHGFFNRDMDMKEVAGVITKEDLALQNSGLLMAGAANRYRGGMEIPEDIDDGILTSAEIADLDLSKVEIAVLSACETGLGEISGDGVFGLQRGFKKAGAKTILMSLWKVDDDATCFLMTEFYRHWLGDSDTGILPKGKYAALEAAKKAVRSNPEWSDPYYWAGFILLDALD